MRKNNFNKIKYSFADTLEKRKSSPDIKSHYSDLLSPKHYFDADWRLLPLYISLFLSCLIILFRAWQLQIIEGKKYRVLSEENRIRFQLNEAPRGIIYDRNQNVLVRNIPGIKISLNPYNLTPEELTISVSKIADILGINKSDIEKRIEEGKKESLDEIPIKENISHDKEIELLADKENIKGLVIKEGVIREYLNGEIFSHLTGITGEISSDELSLDGYKGYFVGEKLGRMGLEKEYEKSLKGTVGQKLVETDANGQELKVIYEIKAASGNGLELNIDKNLQEQVFQSLKKGVEKYSATGGVVIIQEVKTGKVVSLVSYPTFDNNIFAKGIQTNDLNRIQNDTSRPLFNRAISGTYPSGSTIKPLVAAAALNENIITESTLFNDRGVITIGTYRFPDWKIAWGLPPNGNINVVDAIAQSCDTFFYAVGGGYENQKGLGLDNLNKYARKFGLASKTGIDLPGESEGLYPTASWKEETTGEKWYLGDTYWISIGQSYVLTTPMQINNYITAIANDGVLYKPTVVDKILDTNRNVVSEIRPEILNKDYISLKNLEIVKKGMRKAVDQGIIYPLKNTKYDVAAKTGTAEFGQKNSQGYYDSHAWVTGFFPYNNPEYSFTVLLEKGEKSNNAAEVAKEIIDWFYQYRH